MGMVGLRDVFVVAPAASFHPSAPPPENLFSAAEHPIIPLLTATPCLVEDSRAAKPSVGIHLFQPQPPPHQNPNPNSCFSGSPSTCQDCGNQSKKDCSHRRCRTCCKSRGFDCSTHIKSTWVPAVRRRERQLTVGSSAAAGSSASTSASKKARFISSQTTTTSHTSSSFDTSSSHQEMAEPSFRENLPGHVRAPAVFKCVRVTSVDDGEDQYAYQAMVTIGGHIFKGFLYDQGADDASRADLTGNSPANNVAIPNISEMHLGAARRAAAAAPSSAAVLPSDVYASASDALLGGAAYELGIGTCIH